MGVKVMIAFSNMLFAEGITRLLENDDGIDVVNILKVGTRCNDEAIKNVDPDVILVDFITLYNSFYNVDTSKQRFLLLDTACGKDNIVSAILTKKLSGVLLGQANTALLKKAIKAVAKGEVWIDKSTVKNLLYGINALNRDKSSVLTEREREIVSLIGQGYKNKEIAKRLHISEPTVKTHLCRIFQKLGIKNRSQLITYAIKHSDTVNFFLSKRTD